MTEEQIAHFRTMAWRTGPYDRDGPLLHTLDIELTQDQWLRIFATNARKRLQEHGYSVEEPKDSLEGLE